MSSLNAYAIGALIAFTILVYRRTKYQRFPRPPGPKGLPLVGNVIGVPTEQPWLAFKEWSDQYKSDIVSLQVFGKDMIILNSNFAAQELFARRWRNYSGRPFLPMVIDLMRWDWVLTFLQFNQEWKDERKILRQSVTYSAQHVIQPRALFSSRRLLKHILKTPKNYMSHVRHFAGLTVVSTAYGIDVKPEGDPYVDMAERTMSKLSVAGNFGTYLVDFFPILEYVPPWFPGAQFRRDAEEWAQEVESVNDGPYQIAKDNFVAGKGKNCIASHMLATKEFHGEDRDYKERLLKNALGVVYLGGADTTISTLATFILAMVMHPEAQRRAQDAIEAAIGRDHLPDYEEIQDIPYLHAIVREALRWHPVLPLGVAHRASEDDIFAGYHIPKDAMVIGNAWAMLNDETTFGKDTHLFKPERFLTKDGSALDRSVPNPEMAFGFGRRICPGRVIAYSSVMIAAAALLQCFTIQKARDENGKEIEVKDEYTTGLLSFPKPFECDFQVRSEKLALLIAEIKDTMEE
ncbi:cytochrome P450 [Pluteus cervinus]|uniref:Cytochrome P450 n=1 Tax=Pluteus cervinus TaxID=181527 RepID=A0ACD3AVS7_9AGAR|nr:cytochrome P450 [Pluteus cervinus]